MRNVFVIYDEYTAVRIYSGTYEQCLKYIKEHDGEYYIEEA